MRLDIIMRGTYLMVPAVALVLGGCTVNDSRDSGKLEVAVTFYPLEYLVQRIGGEGVHVTSFVTPGVEPHEWEPTPRDVERIRQSKLFVYHGAGLDPWAAKLIRDLPKNGPQVVHATEGLSIRVGPAEKPGGTGEDPHVWLDPEMYAKQAELVAEGLVKADPARSATYQANLADLKKDLESLKGDMTAGLAACLRKDFFTSHTAFSYLAARFGLNQVGIAGISPEDEPSPARMKEVVDELKKEGATHVYLETLASPKLSETIAREAGVKTLVLNPLEGLRKEEFLAKKDYVSVMQENLNNLRTGLGCS